MAEQKKVTDMQLTKHFRLSEFTRSATATARGLENVPTEQAVTNLKHLCEEVLEPLRVAMGVPIVINSGYRSPALNKAVGGVATSQHMTGEAADIRIPRSRDGDRGYDHVAGRRYMDYIVSHCDYDKCLYEHDRQGHTWIHVSCKRKGNRHIFNNNYIKK